MPEIPEVQTLIDSLLEEDILNKNSKDVIFYMEQLFSDIVGRANKRTGNFIEVRGLGILNISKLYGVQVTKKELKNATLMVLTNA